MNAIKKLFEPVDMTVGSSWKKISLFTVPMLIGNIAQQLYNTVDSIVVGRYVGDNALAAVGSAGPILNLLIILFVGISVGAGIVVSQYFGAKERENLSGAIGNCITLTAIASIVIMILAPLIARPLLTMLHTPDTIIAWCTSYLIILFVAKFNMGVNGVALATVIAQGASAVLCLLKLLRMKEYFDLSFHHLKLQKTHAKNIIRLGLPSGLTQAIFSMATIVVQSLTNSFGEQFIAANVIVMRVDGFAMLPNFSFGNALTTYAGQNIGAKQMKRVEDGARQGTILAVGTTAVITGFILLFGRNLMGIFTTTEELVTLSMKLLIILSIGYVAMAVTQSLSGIMRGAGDTLTPMWISFVVTIVIRVPLAYGLVFLSKSNAYPSGRGECIYISLLISWLIGAILTVVFYKLGKWKTKGIKSC